VSVSSGPLKEVSRDDAKCPEESVFLTTSPETEDRRRQCRSWIGTRLPVTRWITWRSRPHQISHLARIGALAPISGDA